MAKDALADRLGTVAIFRGLDTKELHRIVEVASRAPSVHNTQPWRWRIAF